MMMNRRANKHSVSVLSLFRVFACPPSVFQVPSVFPCAPFPGSLSRCVHSGWWRRAAIKPSHHQTIKPSNAPFRVSPFRVSGPLRVSVCSLPRAAFRAASTPAGGAALPSNHHTIKPSNAPLRVSPFRVSGPFRVSVCSLPGLSTGDLDRRQIPRSAKRTLSTLSPCGVCSAEMPEFACRTDAD